MNTLQWIAVTVISSISLVSLNSCDNELLVCTSTGSSPLSCIEAGFIGGDNVVFTEGQNFSAVAANPLVFKGGGVLA